LLSEEEAKIFQSWDKVAPRFRVKRTETVAFKDVAFREVYGELITQIIRNPPTQKPLVLKTDLWNEGIEIDRSLASFINCEPKNCTLVCWNTSSLVSIFTLP
jgi:hypothetical protein